MAITCHYDANAKSAEAAEELRRAIEPDIGPDDEIHILSDVQCFGQQPRDIDVIVLGRLKDGRQLKWYSPEDEAEQDVWLRNFLIVVEVKDHTGNHLRVSPARVEVKYRDRWEDVTQQSEGQKYSLANFLRQLRIEKPPFVVNLIWLRNANSQELPGGPNNVLGRRPRFYDLVKAMFDTNPPFKPPGKPYRIYKCTSDEELISTIPKRLYDPVTLTQLDRKKLERITRRVLRDQRYHERLGTQLLMFRGHGGTGKTIRLLQMSTDIYERGDRCLILTYNKALVADIARTLALARIGDSIARAAVDVRTVHSFMREVMLSLGVVGRSANDYLDRYEDYLGELLELVNEKAATSADLEGTAFSWDFILIDEGQDWLEAERDVLYGLFGPARFVVADGVSQLVRSTERCRWEDRVPSGERQIVALKRSLRLKSNLCSFDRRFAQYFDLDEWEAEEDRDVHGGSVIFLLGDYTAEFHARLLERNAQHGNRPIDMLFCIPAEDVSRDESGRRARLAKDLTSWGHEVWDGTHEDVRSSAPISVDQHRVVQYESCRGLEGWIVVNLGFDQFYRRKYTEFTPRTGDQVSLLEDEQSQRQRYALQWSMIPLTRAIDTQVIQLRDRTHPFSKRLLALAEELADFVEITG